MSCTIIVNQKNEQIESKYFNKLLNNLPNADAALTEYKNSILYLKLNNGKVATQKKSEADAYFKDLSKTIDGVTRSKSGLTHTILVPKPKFMGISDVRELQNTVAFKVLPSGLNDFTMSYSKIEDAYGIEDTEISKINPHLEKTILEFAKANSINIKAVNEMTDRDGNLTNAVAKADLIQKTVSFVKGELTDLIISEEMAHMMVAMLGKDHVLVKGMMREVENMPEYNLVKELEPEFSEEMVRFEAVGRVLANNIVNQSNNPEVKTDPVIESWWTRLLNVLRRLVGKANTEKINAELDAFSEVAKKVLNAEVIVEGEKFDIIEAFHKAPTQSQLEEEFKNTRDQFEFEQVDGQSRIKKAQGKVVESLRYLKKTGELVKKRVSDLYASIYGQAVSDEEQEAFEKRYEINSYMGTEIHDSLENKLGSLATKSTLVNAIDAAGNVNQYQGKNDNFSKKQSKTLVKGAKAILKEIENTQEEINNNTGEQGKANIYFENLVYDDSKDIAGSIDLLVIYSDGSASIYDYKTIEMKTEPVNIDGVISNVVTQQWIKYGKEKGYQVQLSEYKRILGDKYGVESFRNTRIIPIRMQFDRQIQGDPYTQTEIIEMMELNKQYLIPIPMAFEFSDSDRVNKVVDAQRKKIEKLEIEVKKVWEDKDAKDAILADIIVLKKSIQGLLVNNDALPLFKELEHMVTDIQENLEELPDWKLNEYEAELGIYIQVVPHMQTFHKGESADFNQLIVDLINVKDTVSTQVRHNFEEATPLIAKPQREMAWINRTFGSLSMFSHPIFVKFKKLVQESFNITMAQTKELALEAKAQKSKLLEWGKANGRDIMSIYRLFINPNSGNLVQMFSPEFYQTRTERRKARDHKWFRDNYTYDNKERYEADLAKKEAELARYADKDSIEYKAILKQWKSQNDLSNNSAWLNFWAVENYTTFKNEEDNYSEQYIFIKKHEALHNFYQWYIEKNEDFNTRVDQKINKNFVANIQKSMLSTIGQNGDLMNAAKNSMESLHNSLQVRQNDSVLGNDDNQIPLLYMDGFKFRKKDGTYEEAHAEKSEDLLYNIVLFGNSVYNNKNMSDIEDGVNGLKILLKNVKMIKTNIFGKAKTLGDKITPDMADFDPKAVETLDKFTDALLYGKHVQSKDLAFKIGDRVYSRNKVILKLLSYMSIKSLSGNYVSGLAGGAAAYANSYIKGVGGVHYTPKQMMKAHQLMASRGKKDLYNHLKEYFNIERDFWVKEKADLLSASKLTQNLTYDKFYFIQQNVDEFASNTILIAMMQSHGFSSEGKIEKMVNLPEGSKSLLDASSVVNDKVVIEGMENNPEEFKYFRNKVRYVSKIVKGTNTSEDLSLIQTMVIGKAVMHFRNWIAPMIKERFGNVTYTEEIREWEAGRYRIFVGELTTKKLIPTMGKMFLSLLQLKRMTTDPAIAKQMHKKFIEANKDIPIGFEEYMALRNEQLATTIKELQIVLSSVLLLATMALPDDDDRKFYTKYPSTRQFMRLANRLHAELTFFVAPASTQEILKSPIPVMRLGEDVLSFLSNTADQTRDDIFGQNNEFDRTGRGSKTKRLLPFASWAIDLLTDFTENEEE